MDVDDLPGEPFKAKIRCPVCGWDFAMGLRLIDRVEDDEEEHRAVTCCSKCLRNISFNLDGSDVREVTMADLAAMPAEVKMMILRGQFIAWLAQHSGDKENLH